MTPDERKAWEELTQGGIATIANRDYYLEVYKTILAADAEMKRLREIVEHVCDLMDKSAIKGHWGRRTTVATDEFIAELRRRAKEGR